VADFVLTRDEALAILVRSPTRTETWRGSVSYSRRSSVGKKGWKKTTAEEWARQRANQERLDELILRRLEAAGTTRAELFERLGLPKPDSE
jgi:hypothetical protein